MHNSKEIRLSRYFDRSELDTEKAQSEGQRSSGPWYRRGFKGSRGGIILSRAVATLIFLMNLSVFLWGLSSHEIKDGLGTLYRGDCAVAKRTNSLIQIMINALGTLLLAASNYCMQNLSSPTRQEVDEAHAKRNYLCIGAPSFTNLRNIARKQALLWIVLGLSALPIHFL